MANNSKKLQKMIENSKQNSKNCKIAKNNENSKKQQKRQKQHKVAENGKKQRIINSTNTKKNKQIKKYGTSANQAL